ncbi:NDP-sugar synthase [Streptomyces sp. NPDC006430]|uniref:nucleotidyltransferase family protein n=1 Tax=Streptomyces sp. NPDC006430 TaxID=3154299 RepID=UPI0033BA3151
MNASRGPLHDVTVIVLAGGRATRLAPLGSPLAKAMLPIGGHPYIGYLAAHYLRLGVASVHVAAGHRGESIADYFRTEPWLKSAIVVEVSDPQGTGYDVVRTAKSIDTHLVLLVMGDVVTEFDPSALVRDFHENPSCCTLVVCDRSPQNEGALAVRSDGLLLASAEAGSAAARFPGTVHARKSSTGAALMDRSALTATALERGTSMERDLFPRWIGEGKMRTFDIGSAFFWDFGTPERYGFIADRPEIVERLYGRACPEPRAPRTGPSVVTDSSEEGRR